MFLIGPIIESRGSTSGLIDLELPIDADQVQVEASSASVTVSLDYTVPVDLKVYTVKLHFTSSARNKSL